MKRTVIALFAVCVCVANAEIPNPAFGEADGGGINQISAHFGQSVRGGMEELFIAELCYSQPNRFFRFPGRQNIEFLTQQGIGGFSDYNQALIFGFSQDMITPGFWRMYAGINLGIYIKGKKTGRIGSEFTFGERVFLGYRVTKDYILELYGRHFSNGGLTEKNAGQNFIGLSAARNF